MREEKDSYRFAAKQFPMTCVNMARETLECNDIEELLEHIRRGRGSVTLTTAILGTRTTDGLSVNPEWFITRDSVETISLFTSYKRFGASIFWDGAIPNNVKQAFDVVWNTMDQIEALRLRKLKKEKK